MYVFQFLFFIGNKLKIYQDKNKRELGTLIKNIYKSQKFTIHSKSVNITVNNKSIETKQLFFYKDGDVIHFSD